MFIATRKVDDNNYEILDTSDGVSGVFDCDTIIATMQKYSVFGLTYTSYGELYEPYMYVVLGSDKDGNYSLYDGYIARGLTWEEYCYEIGLDIKQVIHKNEIENIGVFMSVIVPVMRERNSALHRGCSLDLAGKRTALIYKWVASDTEFALYDTDDNATYSFSIFALLFECFKNNKICDKLEDISFNSVTISGKTVTVKQTLESAWKVEKKLETKVNISSQDSSCVSSLSVMFDSLNEVFDDVESMATTMGVPLTCVTDYMVDANDNGDRPIVADIYDSIDYNEDTSMVVLHSVNGDKEIAVVDFYKYAGILKYTNKDTYEKIFNSAKARDCLKSIMIGEQLNSYSKESMQNLVAFASKTVSSTDFQAPSVYTDDCYEDRLIYIENYNMHLQFKTRTPSYFTSNKNALKHTPLILLFRASNTGTLLFDINASKLHFEKMAKMELAELAPIDYVENFIKYAADNKLLTHDNLVLPLFFSNVKRIKDTVCPYVICLVNSLNKFTKIEYGVFPVDFYTVIKIPLLLSSVKSFDFGDYIMFSTALQDLYIKKSDCERLSGIYSIPDCELTYRAGLNKFKKERITLLDQNKKFSKLAFAEWEG